MTAGEAPRPRLARHRLAVGLSCLTAIVTIAGVLSIRSVSQQVEQNLMGYLHLVLDGTAAMVDNSFETLAHQARIVRFNEDVAVSAQEIAANPTPAAMDVLVHHLDVLTDYPKGLGYLLTDLDGRALRTTGLATAELAQLLKFPGTRGTEAGSDGIRISAPHLMEGAPRLASAELDVPIVFAVRVELTDPEQRPALRLWIFHDARRLFGSFLLRTRSGATGEIYAFNGDGMMISSSRFNEQLYNVGLLEKGLDASLRVSLRDPLVNLLSGGRTREQRETLPLTLAVREATSGKAGSNVDGFNDYRGVPVVGAWRWFEAYGFGVTHEIDVAEAYYNVISLKFIVFGLVAMLLAATAIGGFLSARIARAEEQRRTSLERMKLLQAQIAHVNRVATMGEMATGLAHEITQPLTAVANYARTALNELESKTEGATSRVGERLLQIERNALRCGEIVRRLRKFVAAKQVDATPVGVSGLVEDPLRLLASDIKSQGVAVEIDVSVGLPDVSGDEVQLQQVILNLLRNSLDAMRRIPAGRQKRLQLTARLEGGDKARVRLDIGDSGPGIDQQVKARLFEQFNTTTPNGMGLGLAISRTIIESHGGTIDVTRDSSEGTTFTLLLPVSEAA